MYAAIATVGREITLSHRAQVLAGLLVVAMAAFILFRQLGEPQYPVWDEAYYLPTTARFEQGIAQFATHPPLGLMLIAAGDKFSGLNDDTDLRPIAAVKSVTAERMPSSYDYRGPRLASALFGVLGAGLFFLLMLEISASVGGALILSALYLCDTALITQFRAAHLDAFQLAFSLCAMLSAVRLVRGNSPGRWAFGFGCALSCAALVRANGAILFVLFPFALLPLLRARAWRQVNVALMACLGGALLMFSVVAGGYITLSAHLPDTQTPAGAHDARFMSPAVQSAVASQHWTPAAILAAVTDYSTYMKADLEGTASSDANGSHPYDWLVGRGAITYRWDASKASFAALGLIPNLAVWIVSLAGVISAVLRSIRTFDPLRAALLACWVSEMAVLVWLDDIRVLYLYHYFIPLLLGHALFALAWTDTPVLRSAFSGALLAIAACFTLAAPLALHQQTSLWRCEVLLPRCSS